MNERLSAIYDRRELCPLREDDIAPTSSLRFFFFIIIVFITKLHSQTIYYNIYLFHAMVRSRRERLTLSIFCRLFFKWQRIRSRRETILQGRRFFTRVLYTIHEGVTSHESQTIIKHKEVS